MRRSRQPLRVDLQECLRFASMDWYGEGGPAPAGLVKAAIVELEGRQLTVLNGGFHVKYRDIGRK